MLDTIYISCSIDITNGKLNALLKNQPANEKAQNE